MGQATVMRMLLEILSKDFKGAAHHPDRAVWMSASTTTWNQTADLVKLTQVTRLCLLRNFRHKFGDCGEAKGAGTACLRRLPSHPGSDLRSFL